MCRSAISLAVIGCVLLVVLVQAHDNDEKQDKYDMDEKLQRLDLCKTHRCGYGATCIIQKGRPVCRCQEFCTAEYDPVCGTNGVTYSNLCYLKSAACRLKRVIRPDYRGECRNDEEFSDHLSGLEAENDD